MTMERAGDVATTHQTQLDTFRNQLTAAASQIEFSIAEGIKVKMRLAEESEQIYAKIEDNREGG